MTTIKIKLTCFLIAAFPLFCMAQDNSPYSRYGVGNIVPPSNIANRAMGGISAGYSDPTSINSVNPATYSDLIYSTLDIGLEYDGREIKSANPVGSYKSNNAIVPYLQFGFPLLRGNKKAQKNKTSWGMALGLRQASNISYKIQSTSRNSVDTISTIYQGNGGVDQAFIGTALRFKNFRIGFNTGYLFGSKDYDTRLTFSNDTLDYYKTHSGTQTRFGGIFLDAGVQYSAKLKKGELTFGAYGNLQKQYHATKDDILETFAYSSTGAPVPIDTVSQVAGQKGKVQMPATFGAGFSYSNDHLTFGADYETTQWENYRFFGQKDLVQNSWTARFGLQYLPASLGSTGYFNYVKYRAGFSFGQDYIAADHSLPVYTISVGGAFPMKLKHSFYDHQYSIMNVTFEYGNRGNNQNNLTENIYKLSLGFSLSDIWFIRQKYQ
ncbi:MAG: hypothetical protein ACTHK0_00795 [Ginsengibacter sp.]